MALFNVRSLSSKTFILNDFILSANLDFMFLTESWLQMNDYSQLAELCPPQYDCFSQPRVSGRGGGLVSVYRKNFKCHQVRCDEFNSFEVLTLKVGGLQPIIFVIIYRPPKPPGGFLSELPEFLSTLVLNYDRIVLCGDFNIHVDDPNNVNATDFLNMATSFNFKQHVKGQTHNRGHTLDLVFTLGVSISSVELVDMTISDHRCIVFSCDSPVTHAASPSSVCCRIFNEQSVSKFCAFFQSQSQHLSDSNTNNLVDHFNHICLSSLNITAPLKVRPTSKASKQPWINDSIRSLKRECMESRAQMEKIQSPSPLPQSEGFIN